MKRFFFYILLLHLIITGTFFFSIQQTQAVSISPVKQTIIIDAGGTGTVPLFVTNDTNSPLMIMPNADAFTLRENDQTILWNQPDPAVYWVELPKVTDNILPGETRQINFSISIPEHTPPGAHYLGLFAEQTDGAGQIHVKNRVGSLLFLHVAGTVSESVTLSQIETPSFIWWGDTQIDFTLTNTGNIHVFPTFHVIHTSFGKQTEEIKDGHDYSPLLAVAQQTETLFFPLTWNDVGKHTVAIDITYGATQKHLTRTVTFWYIPIPIILGSIIILLFILWIIIKKRPKLVA
ncbi:MAG: hypothetical protein HOG08_03495 [Candidatus Magasanikbacteria bacterium]|nr:hypothetical protein [Candidatus Magasanikbacteria bacterium]